jgi:hypothetical protein
MGCSVIATDWSVVQVRSKACCELVLQGALLNDPKNMLQ